MKHVDLSNLDKHQLVMVRRLGQISKTVSLNGCSQSVEVIISHKIVLETKPLVCT